MREVEEREIRFESIAIDIITVRALSL